MLEKARKSKDTNISKFSEKDVELSISRNNTFELPIDILLYIYKCPSYLYLQK